MDYIKKEVIKEPKEYVSVSTRLPFKDAVTLRLICNKNNTAPSEYIRDLIKKNIDSPLKKFLAGKNVINYDKTTNSFSWGIELDSGEKNDILKNLSDDFFVNLKKEIEKAIQERNEWVHQLKPGSVGIPKELVGERNG